MPTVRLFLPWSSIIQEWATIKFNTRIDVVCARLVPHCSTNRGCDILIEEIWYVCVMKYVHNLIHYRAYSNRRVTTG